MAALDYLVVNYDAGQPSAELQALLNGYGGGGWRLTQVYSFQQTQRRGIFVQMGTTEYLVVDYDAGVPADDLSNALDVYGADGWSISHVDMLRYTQRRAIFTRGQASGGGGGIEEAPMDGVTYGRRNATWNAALAKTNDTLDGGSF